ncbi:Serine beta-lactamase-like protein LACTB, mitochondrial [Acipenser ruthenus]|uniref:Serine beta-lactamase-like protein LACTB, mitochondrial n=1 Tax=Acipenser ruthenus TaxID=7906 RepID=A0A444UQY6_ACIRT|nr:Serine beta-lactamase-like protein LACTB, mitochondrial [Acipenser ruthenus]
MYQDEVGAPGIVVGVSVDGKQVTITTKMLVSHLSGIRHYEKDPKKVKDEKEKLNRDLEGDKKTGTTGSEEKEVEDEEKDKQPGMRQSSKAKPEDMKCSNAKNPAKKKEFEQEEYYLKVKFENVIQALNLFKNDPLIFKPG